MAHQILNLKNNNFDINKLFIGPVAQLVEQCTHNVLVPGSSLAGPPTITFIKTFKLASRALMSPSLFSIIELNLLFGF